MGMAEPEKPDLNLYAYVRSNPFSRVDPSGKIDEEWFDPAQSADGRTFEGTGAGSIDFGTGLGLHVTPERISSLPENARGAIAPTEDDSAAKVERKPAGEALGGIPGWLRNYMTQQAEAPPETMAAHVVDATNGEESSTEQPLLPFNPVKIGIGTINAALGVKKIAEGATIIIAGGGSVGAVAAGGLKIALGLGTFRRGLLQIDESLSETSSDANVKNLLGLLPFGQEFDDPHEPGPIEFAKRSAERFVQNPAAEVKKKLKEFFVVE